MFLHMVNKRVKFSLKIQKLLKIISLSIVWLKIEYYQQTKPKIKVSYTKQFNKTR